MVGCVQTSATWLPLTMPSPPSTRLNGSRERRSSAFVREDSGRARAVLPSSWIIVAFWIVAIVFTVVAYVDVERAFHPCNMTEETIPMKLTWYGHSAFRIEAGAAKILIDPFLPDNP